MKCFESIDIGQKAVLTRGIRLYAPCHPLSRGDDRFPFSARPVNALTTHVPIEQTCWFHWNSVHLHGKAYFFVVK